MEGVINTRFNPIIAIVVKGMPEEKYINETLLKQREEIKKGAETAEIVSSHINKEHVPNIELDIIFDKIDKFVTPIIEKIYEVFGKIPEWLKMLTTYLKQEIKDISEKIKEIIDRISEGAGINTQNKFDELGEFFENKREDPPNGEIKEIKEQDK